MRMYFRTFNGFEKVNDGYLVKRNTPSHELDEQACVPEGLGREIIYSPTMKLNSRCLQTGDRYIDYPLGDDKGWAHRFCEYLHFMSEYPEIGCLTFSFGVPHENYILTESAHIDAYEDVCDTDEFFIIFNARPTTSPYLSNAIKIGYDRYYLRLDAGSVIVWNLDKYKGHDFGDCTLWGIEHSMGGSLVGMRGGELVRPSEATCLF